MDISGWKKDDIGDIAANLYFKKVYKQEDLPVSKVCLGLKTGVSFPTGDEANEDVLISVPFGNDGSYGLIFGGAINVDTHKYLALGVDAEFLHLFGNTKKRRMK